MQAPPPAHIDLHPRRLGAKRVTFVCLVVLAMIILAPILAGIVGLLVQLASRAAAVIAGVVVLLLVECALLFALLSLVRSAAWLEGSVLVVRTALATRRRDLARAPDAGLRWIDEVTTLSGPNGSVTTVPTGRKIPVLSVRDRPGGKPLRLTLVDPGTRRLLAGPMLIALANALQSGGQWAGRDAAAVQNAVAGLHAIASKSPARR